MSGKVSDEKKAKLYEEAQANLAAGITTETQLETDDRVLARITDGIYRKPSSAIRELIANAYDADATEVHIHTDAPRFNSIRVIDNGTGLSLKGICNLVKSIGGSAKRTSLSPELEISNEDDLTKSRGGRKLIGKLGIGLFSVAQLSNHFRIITKQEGDNHRLVADITLNIYEEDTIHEASGEYVSGDVNIWPEDASDIDAHGTEILILNIKKQVQETLRSKERWNIEKGAEGDDDLKPIDPPDFHIGEYDTQTDDTIATTASLPWDSSVAPSEKMMLLYKAIQDQHNQKVARPKLEDALDNYLQAVWDLSLSIPVDYIETHPFDLTQTQGVRFFRFKNQLKGSAEEVELKKGDSLRSVMELQCPERGENSSFSVYIDGIQLLRPVAFIDQPKSSHRIKDSMIFAGTVDEDLSGRPIEVSGGKQLSFEAYLFWNSLILPKENQGILIRIGDASGTLFDETFMKYQISEQSRLKQLSGEIYIKSGLDAALNIDRESFNTSHPHYRLVMNWLHGAIKQFSNTNKSIGKAIRDADTVQRSEAAVSNLEKVADKEIRKIVGEDYDIPEVLFVEKEGQLSELRKDGNIALSRESIFSERSKVQPKRKNATAKMAERQFNKKIEAVAKVLHAHGLFDDMPYSEQEEILRAIVNIFSVGGE